MVSVCSSDHGGSIYMHYDLDDLDDLDLEF